MPAEDHLSPDQFSGPLFHATHERNRGSIEQGGLRAEVASKGHQPGVWGFHRLEHAAGYGGHKKIVVEYKPSALQRRVGEPGAGYDVTDAVPPENIIKIHGPWG